MVSQAMIGHPCNISNYLISYYLIKPHKKNEREDKGTECKQ